MEIKYEDLFNHVRPAVESKREEFHFYGYRTVTDADIWKYCVQKKWRKRIIGEMRTHEIINGVMELTPAEYMTYTQIEEQRSSDWFSDLNSEELQLLLAPRKDKQN
ncbi:MULTISPECIES: post-transcriptional regulator [Sporosarcina]|uniref:post-transcriptional regulator n=1 Tax=Sporosarcina TaxID=1569 RepID=UPI0005903314|nr:MULTISPECIES: post-transcriptional regulator [Sporosarcina]WJY28203.1 post-transcriptional regulator [Sporosarcina sp. 0.2-SM1T-5]